MDSIERFWEEEARGGGIYTVPWAQLTREAVEAYVAGGAEPEGASWIPEREVLREVAGRDVLCLASGGGQQSAVYGLLGARVTVVDLSEAQLSSDRRAPRLRPAARQGRHARPLGAARRRL